MINKHKHPKAFTLVEMMVVMAILAALLTVALPFTAAGDGALKLQQTASDIAQTIRYAIVLSHTTQKKVSFILDTKNSCYYLETTKTHSRTKPVEDFTARRRAIDDKIQIFDTEGLTQKNRKLSLTFDYQTRLPTASITLKNQKLTEKITIKEKYVQVHHIRL